MKIGLILPANPIHSPYLNNYTRLLEKWGVTYEVIYWRKIDVDDNFPKSTIFNYSCDYQSNAIKKMVGYSKFSRFSINEINKKKFDKLIIFVPQLALFMSGFLEKWYKNNYIFDIRDYSPILKSSSKRMSKIIGNSSFTVISSKGFIKWLPGNKDYIISNNLNSDLFNYQAEIKNIKSIEKITISNIGSIRHYNMNIKVINQLRNNYQIDLRYIGQGICEEDLKNYCIKSKINNVSFQGRYDKEEELSFYANSDMVNLIQPNNSIGTQTAMANRIYNAAITRKPVIVSSETYMAEITDKYSLGLVVNPNKTDLIERINFYKESFDLKLFSEGCKEFIREVELEEKNFEEKLNLFLSK